MRFVNSGDGRIKLESQLSSSRHAFIEQSNMENPRRAGSCAHEGYFWGTAANTEALLHAQRAGGFLPHNPCKHSVCFINHTDENEAPRGRHLSRVTVSPPPESVSPMLTQKRCPNSISFGSSWRVGVSAKTTAHSLLIHNPFVQWFTDTSYASGTGNRDP